MGKITGFMDYNRKDCKREDSLSRLKHWNEFDTPLNEEERKNKQLVVWIVGFRFAVQVFS